MKHIILCSLITLFSLSISSQETSLTINVSPGKLKEAMTAEQMALVKELTLTGEMDNSDFYVIRDNMNKLEKLDLSKVIADTIPVKAFQGANISSIILMKELKCIQDYAFCNMWLLYDIEFTGKFPVLGKNIFDGTHQVRYIVGEENIDCTIINECVYSPDTTILYLASKDAYEAIIEESTKQISSYAFDGCFFRYGRIHIPTSVDFIGDHAFLNVQGTWPTDLGDSYPITVTCSGLIPATLGEDVFSNDELKFYALFVPNESVELYRSAPQWEMFGTIKGYNQNTSLTINVSPGKLKEAMTAEQMALVKELTLTGEMDNSDFYVIGDNMKNLEVLDMENVIADTIPEYGLSSLFLMNKIVLPSCLSVIQFAALSDCYSLTTVVWTSFPISMAQSIFSDSSNLRVFEVSKSNLDCVSVDGVLFSSDGKKLLRFPSYKEKESQVYNIPEGTEIIGEYAFNGAMLTAVTLPSTLKEIEDYAFWVSFRCPVGSGDCISLFEITSRALVPPNFMGAFYFTSGTDLWVSEGYEDIYRQSNWGSTFRCINGETSVAKFVNSETRVWYADGILCMESKDMIEHVELFNLAGKCLLIVNIDACSSEINVGNMQMPLICRINYKNGIKRSMKFIKLEL